MDRYCKFFIVLLTLATVIASGQCAGNAVAGLAVNVSVSMKSQMGPNTDLHVHCASDPPSSTAPPGVDYGIHNLVNDEIYNLSFLRQSSPHSDKIIIRCHFLSIGLPPKDVAVYYGLYYAFTNCPCRLESGVERSNWTISRQDSSVAPVRSHPGSEPHGPWRDARDHKLLSRSSNFTRLLRFS